MSFSLDPDQIRCFVGHDLRPNLLNKLSKLTSLTALVDKIALVTFYLALVHFSVEP